jgi:hypothetical protein
MSRVLMECWSPVFDLTDCTIERLRRQLDRLEQMGVPATARLQLTHNSVAASWTTPVSKPVAPLDPDDGGEWT